MPKKLVKSDKYSVVFNNLIDLCDSCGTSVSTLIKKHSTSTSAINAWKNGNINMDIVPEIIRELDISYETLFERKEKSSPSLTLSDDEQKLLTYYKELSDMDKGILIGEAKAFSGAAKEALEEPKNTIFIEIYDLPVSAGTGVYLDNCDKDMMEVDEDPLTTEANFALRVSGNSMEPDFHDGDIILVRSQPTVELGEIGIFILDGEGFVKEFGGDQLISHNKEYKNIKLEEYSEIYCRGLVLGVLESDKIF